MARHLIEPAHPWVSNAYQEMAREVRETGKNPEILKYFDTVNYDAQNDWTNWCSAFMAWCFDRAGIEPQRSVVARHWLRWGEATNFQPGAVVVFWRESKNSWKGHVAIALDKSSTMVKCIGGNQNNKVGVNYYKADQVLGYRWPKGYTYDHYYGFKKTTI